MTNVSDLLTDIGNELDAAKGLTEFEADPTEALAAKLERFARIENARRDLEDALKRIKEVADTLREPLWEEMVTCGMTNANVHGLRLYGMNKVIVSKKSDKDGVTTDMVCEALQAIGRGDMVRDSYSASSLTSLVKEWKAEGRDIPAPLEPLLNVFEKTVLTSGR